MSQVGIQGPWVMLCIECGRETAFAGYPNWGGVYPICRHCARAAVATNEPQLDHEPDPVAA